MSYPFSDSESSDSDSGIRFKTDSTRNKTAKPPPERKSDPSRYNTNHSDRRRHSDSRRRHDQSRRRRSRSRSRDQTESRTKSKHDDRHHRKHSSSSSDDRRFKIDKPADRSIEDKHKSLSKESHSPVSSSSSKNSFARSDEASSSTENKRQYSKKDDDNLFGPLLPPKRISVAESSKDSDEVSFHGPSLPPHLTKKSDTYGPQPPTKPSKNSEENIPVDDTPIGPSLPPHLLNKADVAPKSTEKKTSIIGPVIPADLREKLQNADVHNTNESSDDDEIYGPVPLGHKSTSSHIKLEERALQMKLDSLNPSDPNAIIREEWMLELPQVKAAGLGLGPRQFRTKAGPDMSDRSSWTDTPQDKVKKTKEPPQKIDIKKEAELKRIAERDKEQERLSKEHKKKKKRDKSLLDIHQEDIKKKKKDSKGDKPERRPFDRDIDLKINRFDDAQKKAILKKAQLLDDRFSRGESKFL